MRTVTFKSVLEGVAKLDGIDPASGSYSDELVLGLVEYINLRIEEAWEWEFWPEWTVVEQRAYRQAWVGTTTYAIGDEVFNAEDDLYYTALTANINVRPDTSAVDWSELTSFERYVGYNQTGETPLGTVKSVYSKDPRKTPRFAGEINFLMNDNGVMVSDLAPAQVFVEFRKRPPVFTSSEWLTATAYVVDDLVYHVASDECYKALLAGSGNQPDTATTFWEKIDFPLILAPFVKRAAYSDYLKEDGQHSKGDAALGRAYEQLYEKADAELAQQRQYERAKVDTY